jgi:hypothetical protein
MNGSYLQGVGRGSCVQVSVRSLPRSDAIPRVLCEHYQQPPVKANVNSSSEDEDAARQSSPEAFSWKEVNNR